MYTKTGPTTATLSLTDAVLGPLTASISFTAANSGNYTVTSPQAPGASQTGSFVLYAGAAPASIAGAMITVTITSGTFAFAPSGSYQFLPAGSGNSYSVKALSGSVMNSSGTYAYSATSPTTGVITFDDSLLGAGSTDQLSFDTATSGTLLLRSSSGHGYQTALFSLVIPTVASTITVPPARR